MSDVGCFTSTNFSWESKRIIGNSLDIVAKRKRPPLAGHWNPIVLTAESLNWHLSRSIGIPVGDRYCSLAIIYVMLRWQSVTSKWVLLTLMRINSYVFQVLHPNSLSLPGDRVRDNKGKSLLLRNVSLSNLCISSQNKLSSPSCLDV